MKFLQYAFLFLLLFIFISCSEKGECLIVEPDYSQSGNAEDITPVYPVPSIAQYEWQKDKLEMFIHFGINTFTGNEWGDGTDDPKLFNPTKIDPAQWVKTAKDAGFKLIILTVKHHDGFCLWPSAFTDYSVKNSPWKNGKGDVVKEFVDACNNAGMKYGFYLSPWDRHDSTFGTSKYDDLYVNYLTELCTNYGNITEIWLDGAPGTSWNGVPLVYNWKRYYSTIKKYQPNALISSMGPDIGWIGNEQGLGNLKAFCYTAPSPVFHDQVTGLIWYPGECDVSIRPGWFWHKKEDSEVKSLDDLFFIYKRSVGRNSNLLLNVPVNTDGVISEVDCERLSELKRKIEVSFGSNLTYGKKVLTSNVRGNNSFFSGERACDNWSLTFWATDDTVTTAWMIVDLGERKTFNTVKMEEELLYGQRVLSYKVEALNGSDYIKISEGTSIGRTKIDSVGDVITNKVKFTITSARGCPLINSFELYNIRK